MKLIAYAATAMSLAGSAANASTFDTLVEVGPNHTTSGNAYYYPEYEFGYNEAYTRGALNIDPSDLVVWIFAWIGGDGTFDESLGHKGSLQFLHPINATVIFEGELREVMFVDDTMLALFDTNDPVWGSLVRATIDFDEDWSGGVDLLDTNTSSGNTITLDAVALIPVPATLPLLAGGIAMVAVARRRAG